MKRNQKQSALDWMREEADWTTSGVLTVLNARSVSDYEGVPREIVKAIHNLALHNLARIVNFPGSVVKAAGDAEEPIEAYEESAVRQSRELRAFCDALARWRPLDESKRKPQKSDPGSKRKKRQKTPLDSRNASPETPEEELLIAEESDNEPPVLTIA